MALPLLDAALLCPVSPARTLLCVLASGLGSLWIAAAAQGQEAANLNALALDWSRGRYVSPIVCEVDGEMIRGGRRVMVAPGPRHVRPAVNRIVFRDLEIEDATRCFNELGESEPNIIGRLDIRLVGRGYIESAERDFEATLKRKGGFEFHVPAGSLRIQEVGQETVRSVDFRGGKVRLLRVARGSDAERRLSGLRGLRNLLLEIEARDGTLLRLPLVMTEGR